MVRSGHLHLLSLKQLNLRLLGNSKPSSIFRQTFVWEHEGAFFQYFIPKSPTHHLAPSARRSRSRNFENAIFASGTPKPYLVPRWYARSTAPNEHHNLLRSKLDWVTAVPDVGIFWKKLKLLKFISQRCRPLATWYLVRVRTPHPHIIWHHLRHVFLVF